MCQTFFVLKNVYNFITFFLRLFENKSKSKKEKVGMVLEFFPWGRPLRPKWSCVKLKSHTHTHTHTHTSIDTHVHA